MKVYCIEVWFCGTNRWYLTDFGDYDIHVSRAKYDAFTWTSIDIAEEVCSLVTGLVGPEDFCKVVEY